MKDRNFLFFTLLLSLLIGGAEAFSVSPSEVHRTIYPFIETKTLTKKRGVVVIPSEEGPSICEPLVKMFEMSFQYVGMKFQGVFLVKAYEKGEIEIVTAMLADFGFLSLNDFTAMELEATAWANRISDTLNQSTKT